MALVRRHPSQRTPHISPRPLLHFPFSVSVSRCCPFPLLFFEFRDVFTPPACSPLPIPIPIPSSPRRPFSVPIFFTAPQNQTRRAQSRCRVEVLAGRRFPSSPCGSRAERGGDPRAFVLGERLAAFALVKRQLPLQSRRTQRHSRLPPIRPHRPPIRPRRAGVTTRARSRWRFVIAEREARGSEGACRSLRRQFVVVFAEGGDAPGVRAGSRVDLVARRFVLTKGRRAGSEGGALPCVIFSSGLGVIHLSLREHAAKGGTTPCAGTCTPLAGLSPFLAGSYFFIGIHVR